MENQELMNIIFGITISTGVEVARGVNSRPNKKRTIEVVNRSIEVIKMEEKREKD